MAANSMSLGSLIERVKAHPQISRAGMILCHNGIVREFDRSGARRVIGLRVVRESLGDRARSIVG